MAEKLLLMLRRKQRAKKISRYSLPAFQPWMEIKLQKTQFRHVRNRTRFKRSSQCGSDSMRQPKMHLAIFCMTESHRALLQMYFDLPEKTQIFLMREFIQDGSKELPDPFGQSLEVYRDCRENMKEALPSLLNWVEKNL